MKNELIIGDLIFNSKKAAIEHFKRILNSYNFGQSLSKKDFDELVELIKLRVDADLKIGVGIKDIVIAEGRYKSKCFKLIRYDFSEDIFSYLKCINGERSHLAKFNKTCRDLIDEQLRLVKLQYFKDYSVKGFVKCQESGEMCQWEELNVDHRQPNTFSIIVDRFIELNNINVENIEYHEIIDAVYEFKNSDLNEKFKLYHKDKANLRIVKKGLNLGRSYQARIGTQKKDLRIS